MILCNHTRVTGREKHKDCTDGSPRQALTCLMQMGIGTLQATLFYFIIYKIRPHVTVRGGVGFPLCNVLSQGSDRIGSMPDHFTTNSDKAENFASDPELKKVEMMTILGLIYIYIYICMYGIYYIYIYIY